MTKRKSAAVLLEDKPTGGRARVKIDETVLKALAAVGCSLEEICEGLRSAGCTLDVRTLKRRLEEPHFRNLYVEGKNSFKIGIRRQQKRQSMLMNSAGVQMTIHLSKHFLGQTDKSLLELTGKDGGPVETKDVSAREVVAGRIAGIAARKRATEDSQ